MRSRYVPLFLAVLTLPLFVLMLSCAVASGKPSTSAPKGISDPDEFERACKERQLAIDDWESERMLSLEGDPAEQERIKVEAEEMRWDLGGECTKRSYELHLAAEERSIRDCDDCLSVRQLVEEYEANSFATKQRYMGTRHNFNGTVESVGQEPSVPPKPLIRVKSDGAEITFRFGWEEDYSWVLDLSRGDWVKANCQISSIGTVIGSRDIIPFLKECTKAN